MIPGLVVNLSSPAALCVVGNKTDLSDRRQVSREKGEEFAHQIGAMYTETSAADNTGELFETILVMVNMYSLTVHAVALQTRF